MFKWLSRRLSTGSAQVALTSYDDSALRNRVAALETTVLELEDRQAVLEGAHRKLRGRLTGGLRPGANLADAVPPGDRAGLRRAAAQMGLLKVSAPDGEHE